MVYPKQDVAMMKCLTSFCVFFLTFSGVHAAVQTVTESARDLPLAYDVDVVVIGGTTRGVAAAQAAAEAGASVFLAAPRPYLGEDMCGTFRLWLNPDETPQSPLGR
ncbi:MAG: heterodisulfide reductase subunit A-like polyferredoxin, partial [Kiritimatiellia bacterium]